MSAARFTHNGLPVPYVTRWEHETAIRPKLTVQPGLAHRLAFADETPYDRDSFDVLWLRVAIRPGEGRALFKDVHALRQRRAMLDLMCQICGVPMFKEDRQLWLLAGMGGVPIREGELTTSPPVCRPCAPVALRYCPRLQSGRVAAAWVRSPYGWGVEAFIHDPESLRMVSPEPQQIQYHDPLAQWAVAFRSVVTLRDCTPVRIQDLADTK
ncbi:hypothetical protein [Streptomyces tsukubensis]|uniref:hypothetical protein n=1 Tax=Streptomyces tsukubensis TaxID=83656 RepID=UPI00344EC988